MELKKRQDDTLAEVTSIEVKADGMVISAKADMPSYGKVRFSINVQSSGERNSAQEEDQQQMVISLQEYFQEDGIERELQHL